MNRTSLPAGSGSPQLGARAARTVMTVTGPVDADSIGFTLPHEHTYCQLWMAHHRFDFPNQLEDDAIFADELGAFRDQGGTCLVDLTLPEIGRRPDKLRELSEATGVSIVMGCGWYRQGYFLPEARLEKRPVADLADELIAEIQGGVGDTGIRPGVIGEIGAEKGWVTPTEERVHRAAGRAQRATGLPLATHGVMSPVALEQLTILEAEGADLGRVAVGHCDSHPYLEFHLRLVERGVFLMFDNIGQLRVGQHEQRIISLLRELIDRGHEDRLLLSHDTCKIPQLRFHGGPGYAYLGEVFLPKLRAAGIPERTIETITRDNPRRWLSLPAQ